jgi:hypothetical protein
MEYTVYSDESYSSAERYRSIGAVSIPRCSTEEISNDIASILISSGVHEFKWKKLKDAKYRFCALKLIDYILQNINPQSLRIDVITWDTQDSRHKIEGRDDISNFGRMFFHLMNALMKRREKESHWYVYPDERMDVDWATIQDCLKSAGKWREYFKNQLFGDVFSEQFYHIREFRQANSVGTPCCQIADLFAGMAVFSKKSYPKYAKWCKDTSDQLCFLGPPDEIKCTNREKERFHVIKRFTEQCKINRLGVSIKTKKRLSTFKPMNPINFWWYKPQHSLDKAPIRNHN